MDCSCAWGPVSAHFLIYRASCRGACFLSHSLELFSPVKVSKCLSPKLEHLIWEHWYVYEDTNRKFEIWTLPENPEWVMIPLTKHPEGKDVGKQLGEANSDSKRQTIHDPGVLRSGECEEPAWKNKDMARLGRQKWERDRQWDPASKIWNQHSLNIDTPLIFLFPMNGLPLLPPLFLYQNLLSVEYGKLNLGINCEKPGRLQKWPVAKVWNPLIVKYYTDTENDVKKMDSLGSYYKGKILVSTRSRTRTWPAVSETSSGSYPITIPTSSPK